MRSLRTALAVAAFAPILSFAQSLDPIALPRPRTTGGKPLMEALSDRHSTREFDSEKLSPQMLSNLLWAAWGINRPDGRRTAPSAVNAQEIGIYVVTPEAAYFYDVKGNRLVPTVLGDLRAATGQQPYVATAAVDLVYVADMTKERGANAELYAAADTGFIAQNVYLFCASEGLGTVIRAMIDKPALAQKLKLGPNEKIILSQSVGYPKKN
jgi:nitroreductase